MQLKRTVGRWSNPVKIDFYLFEKNLNKYIDNNSKDKNEATKYELESIIWHGGDSSSGGHYKTWSKKNGNWYEFNDSSAKSVKLITTTYEDNPGILYIQDYHMSDYKWLVYMVQYKKLIPFVYNIFILKNKNLLKKRL